GRAKPFRFSKLSLRERPRLPSTARIGRAQFYRARSASKEAPGCSRSSSSSREQQIQSDHNDGGHDVHSHFPEGIIHTIDQDRADECVVNRPDPSIGSTSLFSQGERGPERCESDQNAENSVHRMYLLY